jgi:hypothetical protein
LKVQRIREAKGGGAVKVVGERPSDVEKLLR